MELIMRQVHTNRVHIVDYRFDMVIFKKLEYRNLVVHRPVTVLKPHSDLHLNC